MRTHRKHDSVTSAPLPTPAPESSGLGLLVSHRASDVPFADVVPGVRARRVVDQSLGSAAITLGELELAAGATLPLHSHKIEEVILVLEGVGVFVVQGERVDIGPGSVVLVPAGQQHGMSNAGDQAIRIVFAYPSINVERVWV